MRSCPATRTTTSSFSRSSFECATNISTSGAFDTRESSAPRSSLSDRGSKCLRLSEFAATLRDSAAVHRTCKRSRTSSCYGTRARWQPQANDEILTIRPQPCDRRSSIAVVFEPLSTPFVYGRAECRCPHTHCALRQPPTNRLPCCLLHSASRRSSGHSEPGRIGPWIVRVAASQVERARERPGFVECRRRDCRSRSAA